MGSLLTVAMWIENERGEKMVALARLRCVLQKKKAQSFD
jgi:hypothetical protein